MLHMQMRQGIISRSLALERALRENHQKAIAQQPRGREWHNGVEGNEEAFTK